MRIADLSQRSGVSIPTIKFYIREGLVPRGEHTAKNQATYDERHLERLDLIQALRDGAGLGLAEIGRVLARSDRAGDHRIRAGLEATARTKRRPRRLNRRSAEYQAAWKLLRGVADELGWTLSQDDPAVEDLVAALCTVQKAWPYELGRESLVRYAELMRDMARHEIPDDWDPAAHPDAALKFAVLGTYLFEPLILALRRIAHGERSHEVVERRQR